MQMLLSEGTSRHSGNRAFTNRLSARRPRRARHTRPACGSSRALLRPPLYTSTFLLGSEGMAFSDPCSSWAPEIPRLLHRLETEEYIFKWFFISVLRVTVLNLQEKEFSIDFWLPSTRQHIPYFHMSHSIFTTTLYYDHLSHFTDKTTEAGIGWSR